MFVSGVFNGETTSPSHRARIPSTFAVHATNDEYTLGALIDMEYGIYYRRGAVKGATYELRWYAHRSLPNLYVLEVEATLESGATEAVLNFENNHGPPSTDIVFRELSPDDARVFTCGNTTVPETSDGPRHTVCLAYSPVPTSFVVTEVNSGKTKTFITAIRTSLDALPEGTAILDAAIADLENGMKLAETDTLRSEHVDAWGELWKHGVYTDRPDLAIGINASLFAILSSVRADWPYGLAPGGLTNYYNGHSFWDTETWMYPPMLLLHSDIARGLLAYRFNRLDGARQKALSYSPPWAGAMFPWESAFSGVETCPTWAATGLREDHISADISFAVWQYWLAQRDEEWFKSTAYEILVGVAGNCFPLVIVVKVALIVMITLV
jgi:hypothetical protein